MFGTKHSKIISCKRLLNTKEINKTKYEIFKLKYGYTRLLGNKKYNQVKLGLAVFASAFCTKLAYIKQT